jgi:hypothetical protein
MPDGEIACVALLRTWRNKVGQQGKRDLGIDVLKGMLVVGMIFSHVGRLLGINSWLLRELVTLSSIVSFPGFLFCFGYVAQVAYFSGEPVKLRRLLPGILRLILAFYISAISYELIIAHVLSWEEYAAILIFWTIPAYSEFLPAFALTEIDET